MFNDKLNLNLNWKQTLLLIGYPLILAFTLEITTQGVGYSCYQNLAENFLFSIIILIIVNQLASLNFGRLLVNTIIIFFYGFFIIETGLYILFQTRLNAAYIHVILNTNYNEVKEFSSIYFKHNLIWLLLFFIPLFKFFPKKIYKNSHTTLSNMFYSILVLFFILLPLKYGGLMKWNLPYVAIKSYFEYENQLKVFEEFSNREKDINVKLVTDNEAIIVVLGESTTSKHMAIYGYQRNTTPKLKSLSDSLSIYKNVISSHVFTTASIFDAFTFQNDKTKETNFLIDYLKSAGYHVYWLSNQRPVGFHDNMVSRLASAANESVFLSYNDFRNSTLHDEVLLPMLKKKLSINGKKIIFLHLIGTHYDYKKRYPTKYQKFLSNPKTDKNEIIDTYDNAVLYNDFIVSEIIKITKERVDKSAVLYFSDHGEELMELTDYFGHFEDKPTTSMYEIPFVLYMSPDFEKPQDFVIDESRNFMLDDFSYSFMHFTGVESEQINKSKSIFSTSFKEKKRIIQNGLEYETFKLNENNK